MNTSGNINTKEWTVYRHISPSGKVYVGITSDSVKKRWGRGSGYKNCPIFKHAIDKYGWNNIVHQVMFTGLSEDRAKNLEIDLIRHYKNLGISYNVTDGGDGALGRYPSNETKLLMSSKKRGKPIHPNTLKAVKEHANKVRGIPLTKEVREKIQAANKGKKPSFQTIEALKLYHATHPMSKERIEYMHEMARKKGYKSQKEALKRNRVKIGEKHRKEIVQFSLDGKLLDFYDAAKFASISSEVDPSSIIRCCKGKQLIGGNYLWMYYDDFSKYADYGFLETVLNFLVSKAAVKSGQYIRTEEWRKKKSLSLKGRDLRSDNCKEKMRQQSIIAKSKPVVQLSLDGDYIISFPSITQAAQNMGCSRSLIQACCSGRAKTACGYSWKKVTEEEYKQYKNMLTA